MRAVAAPLAAVGNLRFTAHGVYADYLVSGLPFVFLAAVGSGQIVTL